MCFRHENVGSDRSHMSDLIPFIHSQEVNLIKAEIANRPVSVVFDGTTRLGEAMAIVFRFVDDDLKVVQRLVRLQLLQKSMCGEEIARELITTLSVNYGISSDRLMAAMHDRAATNGVAMRTVKVIYPLLLDVGCFSHMLDLVGEKFCTPHLTEFITWWVSLFSHSPKARVLRREQTSRPISSYSPTRWWSRFEVLNQLMELFGDVELFLTNNNDIAPNTRKKLLTYFEDGDHLQSKSVIFLTI